MNYLLSFNVNICVVLAHSSRFERHSSCNVFDFDVAFKWYFQQLQNNFRNSTKSKQYLSAVRS